MFDKKSYLSPYVRICQPFHLLSYYRSFRKPKFFSNAVIVQVFDVDFAMYCWLVLGTSTGPDYQCCQDTVLLLLQIVEQLKVLRVLAS
jgi:hypothetical protein